MVSVNLRVFSASLCDILFGNNSIALRIQIEPYHNPFIAGDVAARSLNRVQFTVPTEDGLQRLRGYPALSGERLNEQIVAQAGKNFAALGELQSTEILTTFFNNPPSKPATQLADAHGRKLGCLLLALKRGERKARPEWDDAQWGFWTRVERVMVGGGQVRGWFGRRVVDAANQVVAGSGLVVERSGFSAEICLVGLVRIAPSTASHALVFDFGQTSVKCGLAAFTGGAVTDLTLLFSAPSGCPPPDHSAQPNRDQAQAQWDRISATILHGLQLVSDPLRRRLALCISLACYLQNGHPRPVDQGCYGQLQRLTDNLQNFMRDELTVQLGTPMPLVLTHDGAAAAAAHAEFDGVVLTLGTAIGVGFPTEVRSVRRLAERFVVRDKMLE